MQAYNDSAPICSMPACIMREATGRYTTRWPIAINQMVPYSGMNLRLKNKKIRATPIIKCGIPTGIIAIASNSQAKRSRLRDRTDAADGAGFVLEAPALEGVLALADAGRTVPAKTTYFRPKPASGLFVLSS